MERPFPSYKGDDPYIFVSYSHDDASIVYPGITWLRDEGFNIWYDEGISPGASWREELAEAILKCDLFVILVSPRSAKSHNCLKEVNFALEHNRQILAIHQEPTVLSPGLQLALSDRQAIFRHELNDEQYRDKILAGVSSHIQPTREATGTTPPAAVGRSGNSKPALIGVSALAVVAALAFGYWFFTGGQSVNEPAEVSAENVTPEAPSAQETKVRSNWLAVLPFTVLSGGEEVEALSTGLTSQMIQTLQPIDFFSIVNARTVDKYRDRSLDLEEIARELNVRYLIDGNIQKSGDKTRISVELSDGILGQSMWQETMTFDHSDILAMQDEVSLLTTRVLSSKIQTIEMKRLATVPRSEMNADELYLISANFWMDPNRKNLITATEDLRRVLALKPDHPGATSSLAQFLGQHVMMGLADDPAATRDEVCQLADRAVLLAREGQGVSIAAFPISDICGDPARASRLMERIIAQNPESATLWSTYAYQLVADGRFDEGYVAQDKAEALDPDGLWVWYLGDAIRSLASAYQNDWPAVIDRATKAVNQNPGLYWLQMTLANAYGHTGNFEEAHRHWNQVKVRFPDISVDRLFWLYQQANNVEIASDSVNGLRNAGIE